MVSMKNYKYEEDLTAFPQKSHTEKDFPIRTCFFCDGKIKKGLSSTYEYDEEKEITVYFHSDCHKQWFVETNPICCPKCSGSGRVALLTRKVSVCCRGKKFTEECHYCPGARDIDEGYDFTQCDICNGKKRLKVMPTPITKIVGWQK